MKNLKDDAIMLYMSTQTDINEEELAGKCKALRFFKGSLTAEEKRDHKETLERLKRKG